MKYKVPIKFGIAYTLLLTILFFNVSFAKSPYVFIMEDDGLLRHSTGSVNTEEITKRIINKSDDIYDFIVIYTAFQNPYSASKSAYHSIIKNETRGLGKNIPISDHSLAYGSKGRLK